MADKGHRIFAALYDHMNRAAEKEFLGPRRAQLLGALTGEVLDVGAGTGANLPHLSRAARVVATEPDPAMRRRLKEKAAETPVQVDDAAEALPYADASFDAVLFTLVLCTVADADRALAEARRVLRPDGRLIVLEHVRGTGGLARWQDRVTPLWNRLAAGCHPGRDTRAAVEHHRRGRRGRDPRTGCSDCSTTISGTTKRSAMTCVPTADGVLIVATPARVTRPATSSELNPLPSAPLGSNPGSLVPYSISFRGTLAQPISAILDGHAHPRNTIRRRSLCADSSPGKSSSNTRRSTFWISPRSTARINCRRRRRIGHQGSWSAADQDGCPCSASPLTTTPRSPCRRERPLPRRAREVGASAGEVDFHTGLVEFSHVTMGPSSEEIALPGGGQYRYVVFCAGRDALIKAADDTADFPAGIERWTIFLTKS